MEKTFMSCVKAGPAVVMQCAHAIGHGFLASLGYKNLPEALKNCDTVVNDIEGFPAFNCYDGVFMENLWGIHDGTPSPDRWIKDSDHMYPCDDKRIDDKYLLGCWSNQPALIYQQFHGDVKKTGQECIKVTKKEFKEMCFNGLSRQIQSLTGGDVNKVFGMCGLLPEGWYNYCVVVNVHSFYGIGDREVPFVICSRLSGQPKDDCYKGLVGSIKFNGGDTTALCNKIEDKTWRDRCWQFKSQ